MSFVVLPERPVARRDLVGGEWLMPIHSSLLPGSPGVELWSLLAKVTREWSARTDGPWMS